jgi:ABC-type Mn2+/Zn2+ transport system permease subunit
MNHSQRLIREAKRHSLYFLASVFATIISICGIITGLQIKDAETVLIGGICTAVLIISAIHHASESWKNMTQSDQI